jgi:tRNA threonylcarbamoyladenosine biosynthesis protein TsaB
MKILTIRTDKPEAELGVFEDDTQLSYLRWEAHRLLAETIHARLQTALDDAGVRLPDLEGVVVYRGPGSFTGLRIGLSVANVLGQPDVTGKIVGTTGEHWLQDGIARLRQGESDSAVLPEYGAPVHITKSRK